MQTHDSAPPPDSQCLFASGPKVRGFSSWNHAIFRSNFMKRDNLKGRRRPQCKMWIRQVLISRTLSVCGEVAERLKAAVC
jgi:hypothetical protein